MRRGGALLALATALLAAGCGTGGISKAGDTEQGEDALPGQVLRLPHARRRGLARHEGPNLDDAFSASRQQGFKQSTIEQVVRDQIELAVPPMPQNLVKGADADAVAAYVAMVAGKPVAAKNTTRRQGHLHRQLWQLPHAQGRRHERHGRPEPRPAEAVPRRIVQHQVINGGGAMPAFKGTLTAGADHGASRSTSPRSPGAASSLRRRGRPRRGGSGPRTARAPRRRHLARASSSGPPDGSRSRSRRRRRCGARPRSPAAGRRRRPRRAR